jgi:hypothetical protein
MPKAEKTKCARMSTLGRPRTRRAYPLADADPELHGTKAQMRKQNEDRIRDVLLALMPPPPPKPVSHHLGHLPSRPQIGMGTKNLLDAGRWKQIVSLPGLGMNFNILISHNSACQCDMDAIHTT